MNADGSSQALQGRTEPLGEIGEPLLVCGGAYGNLEALTALLAEAAKLGIPNGHIIHTGDAVAYCADPAAAAELLRETGMPAIRGNVEESLAARMPDCGCGFDEGSLCDQLSARWFAYADECIGQELRRWMGTLPRHLTFTMAGQQVRVVHGGARATNSFLYASTPAEDFEAEFTAAQANVIVAGHSGIPFTRGFGPCVWHNSGALGMPANDGTARVWYSLLIPEAGAIRFEHHALDYDHERARAKMIAAGLPGGYAEALRTGLWPSLDSLARAERAATGKPLSPEPFLLPAAAA